MCGLVGTVNLPLPPGVVDQLRHRGPDDAGVVAATVGAHRVELGHRRLAIVDLSAAGHQPMAGPDGSWLAYNGELYNHRELRAALPARAWNGHSDTETLVHWLALRGADGLAALNGMFAFAWLDPVRQRLLLARDPFGIKPLYYVVAGDRLAFASELAPLRALVPAEVDADSIGLALRLRYLPAPFTLYRDVRKLRPGHVLEVDLGGPVPVVRETPFGAPMVPAGARLSWRAATDRYATLLQQAVERQLMADTEVGVLLSGGLDSALVARYARDAVPGRLRAFTVGFEGQYAENEIEAAHTTAASLGIGFEARVVTLDDFLGALRRVVRVVEEPLATTSVVPMEFLAGLAAEHVKVVLSGQGADEPLGGYARYRGFLLAGQVPPPVGRLLARVAGQCGLRGEQLLRGLATAAVGDARERLLTAWEVFAPAEIEALTGRVERRARAVLDYAWNAWPVPEQDAPVARMMRLDLRLGLADDLLLYTDRITMRHSLECRVPYLDHDLIAFLEALPLGYKLGLRGGKRLHRAAAARVLPAAIVGRRKLGFQVPTVSWFRNTGRLRAVFAEHGAGLFRYVDAARVDRVLVEHASGFNRERQIFLLLGLAYLLDS